MTSLRDFFVYQIGAKLIWSLEALIPKFSPIGDTPFFEREQFDWVEPLEKDIALIQGELARILEHTDALPTFQEISEDQANSIAQDNLWKTFFLYGYGYKNHLNCEKAPHTTRLVEAIPGMKTAFFSILLPGKHIPPHRGPYKGVIRCLLGVKIPEPKNQCGLKAGGETRHWEEGQCMIFDDSYQHEAWNKTDDIRVVLFIDIVRPLKAPMSWLNQLILQAITWSPFVQDANENARAWEKKLEQVMNR
jgi:beta-hydroxylase